jgi:hypothetical protein
MKKLLVATVVAGAFLLLAVVAQADEESVTFGAVTATLSWNGDSFDTADARMTITRGGAVAFSQPIPKVVCDGCVLVGSGADDVRINDLDGDGEPEVVAIAATGGSGCCILVGIWDFVASSGTYRELDVDQLTAGFNLDDLDGDGADEIVSQDVRFNVFFTNRADQLYPPQILHYLHQDGVPIIVDVTDRKYAAPFRVNAADAKRRFSRLHRTNPNARGWVATYVADQLVLGHGSTGLRELDRQVKRGIVTRSFKTSLLKRLHRWGYR